MNEQADAFAVVETHVQKAKHIWLSLPDVNSDNISFANERELEALLASLSWLIVHSEHSSMEEQIEILGSGEVVMVCLGSASHTLLLLKNPDRLYIVINRMDGESEAHNLQCDLIACARTDNCYVWELTKHDAYPLYRRKKHHSWP